jgi:hypothetical protein
MLRPIPNRSAAVAWIRARLESGNTLAKRLLALPLDGGSVAATLPPDAPDTAFARFDAGGVTRRAATEPEVAELVAGYLRQGGGRCAVFEDALSRRGDPVLAKQGGRYAWVGDEVYHLLLPGDDRAQVTAALRRATSFSFLGVLAASGGGELRAGQDLAPGALDALARAADHLLVGAYDGEGVLVWSRGHPPAPPADAALGGA